VSRAGVTVHARGRSCTCGRLHRRDLRAGRTARHRGRGAARNLWPDARAALNCRPAASATRRPPR
jgi:hypothetical protein